MKNKNIPEEIMVSICCLAYNHELYIRQCLEGFLMQKTTFSFEILIHDDASTDNTPFIIHEYESKYPQLIKPIYQRENKYSKGISITREYQLPRAKGKYIALCEGDDYWTDPLKLQKQINILESNPVIGIVHTNALTYFQNLNKFSIKKIKIPNTGYIFPHILKQNCIITLTTCFRRSLYEKLLNLNCFNITFPIGDWPIWIEMSRVCEINYINESTGVYRYLSNSLTHKNFKSQIKYLFIINKIQKFYLNKYINEINWFFKLHCKMTFIFNVIKLVIVTMLYNTNILKRKW